MPRYRRTLNTSGSGNGNTERFTVGGSGDYDVDWSYSGNSDSNFIIDEDQNGSDTNFNGPNLIGTSGSGVSHVYSDPGQHFFEVTAQGDWTIKVVTTP